MEVSETYVTAPQVCRRYGGRSDVWLWRLLRDDPKFPRPLKLRGQRYWQLKDLVAWEEAEGAKAGKPTEAAA